jgi:Cu-Zn family superoxide dismutase
MNRVAVLGILCAAGVLAVTPYLSAVSSQTGSHTPAAAPSPGKPGVTAKAELTSADPKIKGTITFTQQAGGVHVVVDVSGVKPGKHGLHVHKNATCGPPPFKEAGDHLDPYGMKHGCASDNMRHLGDLGNITVGANGKGRLDAVVTRISLSDPHHLIVGKAIVLHTGEDDCKTMPAGNSGDRIACGVIK